MADSTDAFNSQAKNDILLAKAILSNGVDGVSYCNAKTPDQVSLDSKLATSLGHSNGMDTVETLWTTFIHPDDVPALNQKVLSSADNPDYKFQEEIRCLHSDGSIFWFRCSGFALVDSLTETNTLVTTYVDISKYKSAENALNVKINRFNDVIDGAHFGSWESNLQTGEKIINERWAGIIGYTIADIAPVRDETLKTHTHPEDYATAMQKLDEYLAGETDFFACQIRMKHRDGHWVWVFTRGKVVSRTENGKAEWMAGSHYDISKIKHNELELTRHKALLEQVNDTAKIGAWEYDMVTGEIYWGDTIRKIFEVEDDYIPTLENSNDFFLKDSDKEVRLQNLSHTFATGEPFEHTFLGKTHQGNLKWILATGNVKFENGNPVAAFGFMQDVDEQKTATLMLSQQEEQFRKTFEFAHNGMCLVSLDGKFLKVNTSLCNMLEYSKKELKSITFQDITHVDFLDDDLAFLQEMLDLKRESYQMEKQYLRKDGSTLYALLSVSVVKDNYGEPLHFVSQINDITKKKEGELLLKQNTELLESINEAAQIGIWEVDLDESTVYWSPIIKKLAGVPQDFTPTLEDAIHIFKKGESRDTIAKCVSDAIEKGISYDVDLEIVTTDNQSKWSRTIGISTFENGKCVKLHGFFQDIDDKKKAAIELARQEQLFRKTFEHAHNGVALVGLNGTWLKVNQSTCDILGYTMEEMYAAKFQDLTHPDDLKLDNELGDELLAGKRDRYQIEKRYFHKNGDIVWAILSVALVKDEKGAPHHYISQIHDITQRKLAEERAETLYQESEDKNKQLTSFAHIVSHNLRSHSGNLSMLFELMTTETSEESRNEILPMVSDAVCNLHETVGYLNEVISLNNQVSQNLSSLPLSAFINKAIVNIKSLQIKSKCEINNSIDQSITVLALPAYLDSIILNFLTNAIKYKSPERTPIIKLDCEKTEDFLALSISDNGLGIDLEANGEKLFGMYKTFHDHPDARGIGLFLSKNQIEAMGGKIEVESKVNQGTTFKIFFKYDNV